jgi:hypothetical protein
MSHIVYFIFEPPSAQPNFFFEGLDELRLLYDKKGILNKKKVGVGLKSEI